MDNKIFIDLDKSDKLPQITAFMGQIDIKKNGRIIVRNSVLEDIDTLTEQELEYILVNFKQYISPILTSMYIPKASTMEVIKRVAPGFTVRFKTEKPGGNKIVPISPEEFFEGEKIFDSIISGINPEWTEAQKYKYLYNQTGIMLSYDLNVLQHTINANFHEKYSRNIFTSISKNWGICASFAAIYDYLCYRCDLDSTILSEDDHDYVMISNSNGEDYLTDPTYDAARLKFGLKTRNFAIPKEEFEKNYHDLKQTEADEYEFSSLDSEEIKEIDQSIGYLENFGEDYTDETLSKLADDLEGSTFNEKAMNFIERIKNIKTIGRPTDADYVEIIRWILSKSADKEFAKRVKVASYAYEDTKELPRKIVFKIDEDNENKKYYEFDYITKEYNEISELDLRDVDKELSTEI